MKPGGKLRNKIPCLFLKIIVFYPCPKIVMQTIDNIAMYREHITALILSVSSPLYY